MSGLYLIEYTCVAKGPFMKTASTSPQARNAARQEADRLVLAEVRAVAEERQAKSAALREARLAKEAEDLQLKN